MPLGNLLLCFGHYFRIGLIKKLYFDTHNRYGRFKLIKVKASRFGRTRASYRVRTDYNGIAG